MLLLLALACDNTVFDYGGGGGEAVVGDAYADVQTIFDGACLDCHGATTAFGGLDLETDGCNAMVSVDSPAYGAPLVDPGNAAGSVLYGKVADTGEFGGGMPQGSSLPEESIATIAAWIDGGAACEDSGTGGTTASVDYTFANVQALVFDVHCTGCHEEGGRGQAETELNLFGATTYDDLVDAPSDRNPTYDRVEPGDPANSFLMRKLLGQGIDSDHAVTSERMPLDGDPLDTDSLALVFGWILEGAPE